MAKFVWLERVNMAGAPHGPDQLALYNASYSELRPRKAMNTIAVMFEMRFGQQLTDYAASRPDPQNDAPDCWMGLDTALDATLGLRG